MIPPPCVWVMPKRINLNHPNATNWNWSGERSRQFPIALLSAFGIDEKEAPHFTGHIGFLKGGRGMRTTIFSRNGVGASTMYRSDLR